MNLNHPHFLVVGPAKTGTTWLYEQLTKLEGFKMPPVKELSFFNEVNFVHSIDPGNAELLKKYMISGQKLPAIDIAKAKKRFEAHRNLNMQYAFEQKRYLWGLYYRYFPRNTGMVSSYMYSLLFARMGGVTTGDISPLYFTIKSDIVKLIAERFPGLKVIFIIREPVDRAWSNIRMNYFSGQAAANFSIDEFLMKPDLGGDYQRAILNWEEYFMPSRIQYMFYDDLVHDSRNFLQQFLNFVKPGTPITSPLSDNIGKGIDKQMDQDIMVKLTKRNLAQYQFLSQKFGPGSLPAQWLRDAMLRLESLE